MIWINQAMPIFEIYSPLATDGAYLLFFVAKKMTLTFLGTLKSLILDLQRSLCRPTCPSANLNPSSHPHKI